MGGESCVTFWAGGQNVGFIHMLCPCEYSWEDVASGAGVWPSAFL